MSTDYRFPLTHRVNERKYVARIRNTLRHQDFNALENIRKSQLWPITVKRQDSVGNNEKNKIFLFWKNTPILKKTFFKLYQFTIYVCYMYTNLYTENRLFFV